MKMSLHDKIASMEKSIADVVTATLSSIRKDLHGTDFVLDDKDENFKTFFLDSAKSKVCNAYNAYVIETQLEHRSRIHKPNNKATNNAQETMVSQSTLEVDDIESKGSAKMKISNSVKYESMNQSRPALNCTPHQRQFPIYQNLATDISALKKAEELQLQNQYRNTMTICGLPIRRRDQKSLLDLFKILCDHIVESVDPIEIKNIESDGQSLTVSFHDKNKRDRITRSIRTNNLKSDKVLKLLPGETSTSVKAFETTTNFYKKLCEIAYAYVSKKWIYSYGITSQGLAIKLAPDSEIVYVRSKNELEAQVLRNDFKSSVAIPSKRIKMEKVSL